MLKILLRANKKRSQLDIRKLQTEKFTGKGNHKVKVESNPHTKIERRLKVKTSKIICIHNKLLRDTENNQDVKYNIKKSNCDGKRVQMQSL